MLTHDLPGWFFLRRQLAVARSTWVGGEPVPLPLLARELHDLATQAAARRALPVRRGANGKASFNSLHVDLGLAKDRAGTALKATCADELEALSSSLVARQPTGADWHAVLNAGARLYGRLAEPGALRAALDDLMDVAGWVEDRPDFACFADRLETFRSLVEMQERSWAMTRRRMSAVLTHRQLDTSGHDEGGRFDLGTPASELDAALADAVLYQPDERDWAIWIATLAGPASAGEEFPTVVEGPIAVCGIRCAGDPENWLDRVRSAMGAAFTQAGEMVPRDVDALDEPMRFGEQVVLDSSHLWSPAGEPPSFLSRISVRARTSEEAADRAFAALRAVLGRHNTHVASDVRGDPWVWTDSLGWNRDSSTRARARGEVFAARDAGHAVATWAADLGPTLDDNRLSLLETRALVNNETVSAEVRLARAVSCLEGLSARAGWATALQNLWVRTAWEMTKRRLLHQLWDVVLRGEHASPPEPSMTYDDIRERQDALKDAAERGDLLLGPSLLLRMAEALEPVHRDSYAWAWQNELERHLADPIALQRMQREHAASCRRAQRHRNFIVHGWALHRSVVLPTTAFVALQLEIAIVAEASSADQRVRFGSLSDAPPGGWGHRTPGALFDA